MIKSYRIGRFGVGFASIDGNHHGPKSTTLKSTVRFYSLGDGGRMTVYRKDGSFLEFDIYWRHWRANKKKCPLPPPGWWCSREADVKKEYGDCRIITVVADENFLLEKFL